MKSNQKLSLLFWLFKAKATKKDGKAPLYVRITIDGKEEELSLSRKVHPDHWDTDLKIVSPKADDAKFINLAIQEAAVDINRQFILLCCQYEKVTPSMLKNAYKGLPPISKSSNVGQCEAKPQTLLTAFQQHIEVFEKKTVKNQRSDQTLTHLKSSLKKVQDFICYEFRTQDLNLADIRTSFAEKFYNYLTLEVEKPLSEVTAKGHIKKISQVLNACVGDERITRNPIKGFKCTGGEKEVEPLEMHQVSAIIEKKLTIARLDEVRDAFIFQCFTGFAFQDVFALTEENILRIGNKGERWLIKERGKTGVSEMGPILPIVETLIAKYERHRCRINGNKLIPVNPNTKYNGYLKEIADICGINRELNTHLARHTFADMMLNNGVPLEDVSKMLGHANIRTTQKYCRVRKSRISSNMEKIRKILFTADGTLRKVC